MIPFLSALLWLATYRLLMRPMCHTVRERRWCLLVTLVSWLYIVGARGAWQVGTV